MSERRDKIRRIKRLQADLHRLAEWRLAKLAQQERSLAEQQEAMLVSLNDEDALHGMFVGAMARRLKSLSGESEVVRAMHDAQSERVLTEAKRLKRVDQMAGRVEDEHRRDAEKRELAQIVDALLARRGDASLP